MNSDTMTSWKEFEQTGSVEAYLKYKGMTSSVAETDKNKDIKESTEQRQSFT